jgi:hypothetical protein
MAQDQEHLTGNRLIRYPFADDSVLSVDEDDKAIAVFGCFVDAVVQLMSPYSAAEPRVTGISVDGKVLSFTLVDAAGFGEPASLTCSATKARFPVISGKTGWCWYTFVMSSDGIGEFAGVKEADPAMDVSGDVLQLSDRCLGRSANGVVTLDVYGGEREPYEGADRKCTRLEALDLGPDWTVSGDVALREGNNMSITGGSTVDALAGVSDSNGLTLNAVPGAGAGRLPCECRDAVEFKTSGLPGRDGHTRLFNDTCYDLVPMLYTPEVAYLRMHVKCKACCTCEMYASIVNDRLVPLKDSVLASKRSLDSTLGKYETNVAKWNSRMKTATPEDIVVSASAVPLDAAGTNLRGGAVLGMMSRCGFSVAVRNDSFVDVQVLLSDLMSNGDVFEAQVSFVDSSLQPRIVKLRPPGYGCDVTLPPGRSMAFTCFVRPKSMVKTPRTSGFFANVLVTAKQGDRTIFSKRSGVDI